MAKEVSLVYGKGVREQDYYTGVWIQIAAIHWGKEENSFSSYFTQRGPTSGFEGEPPGPSRNATSGSLPPITGVLCMHRLC
ncbi:hypothetical protein Y1Q_0015081 [Alligator mississippiensis]|uniref:Uncharacterized protein n=1 Tax=Alligator mississippiensis TaxID=8496 RepID=A0A151P925_ALLMI|nr:hypothetical protein Y1Q_0015081 [Alligator mississippiensis]